MEKSSHCVTCPSSEIGFCGALLGKPSEQAAQFRKFDRQDHQMFRANESIVNPHDAFEYVYVLCDGWAFRFFQRPGGRRQILRFLLPGDLFAPLTVFEETPHFSVQALTDVRISRFDRTEVQARLSVVPAILKVAINVCVGETKDADELSTALGIGSAEERIAYLLCHLTSRLAAHNVIRDHRYRFPLRQKHIAEAVGLTTVHVSRVMSSFHERRLIRLSGGILEVLNPTEFERIGSFR
jgi:CRP-like cAMP-binding protein